MTKEIELLIQKSFAKSIEIAMLEKIQEGQIISHEVMLEILSKLTK